MIKKVTMSVKIDFTIKGGMLTEHNQIVEDNNLSLAEQETSFAETLAEILFEELGDCSDLNIEVASTIKDIDEEKEN